MRASIHIAALSAIATIAAYTASVSPSTPGDYVWSYPAVTNNIHGSVVGHAPHAFSKLRYEDLSWAYEAYRERRDVVGKCFCNAITQAVHASFIGARPLSDTNLVESYSLATTNYSFSVGSDGVELTSCETQMVAWTVLQTNVWAHPQSDPNPGVGDRFGASSIREATFPALPPDTFIVAGQPRTETINGELISSAQGDVLYTNVVSTTRPEYTNGTDRLETVEMQMTNGTVSVWTNRYHTLVTNMVETVSTNIYTRNDYDYISTTNRLAFETFAPVPLSGRYLFSRMTNEYEQLRRATHRLVRAAFAWETNIFEVTVNRWYRVPERERHPDFSSSPPDPGSISAGQPYQFEDFYLSETRPEGDYHLSLSYSKSKPYAWIIIGDPPVINQVPGSGIEFVSGKYMTRASRHSGKVIIDTGVRRCANEIRKESGRVAGVECYAVWRMDWSMDTETNDHRIARFVQRVDAQPYSSNDDRVKYSADMDGEGLLISACGHFGLDYYEDADDLPLEYPSFPPHTDSTIISYRSDIDDRMTSIVDEGPSTLYTLTLSLESIFLVIELEPLTVLPEW